jgi:hypothetical protein
MEKKEKRIEEKKKGGAIAPPFLKALKLYITKKNISCVEFSFEGQVLHRRLVQELQERGYRDWHLE